MQSSHKTNLQGHSNVSSNNWMARPTQQHWPLASPAQLQLWVSPFRPAAATSISAFDDITRKERIRRKTMQSNPLTKLILKATPTSRQTIGWLDPPNNTGLWLLLRNFRVWVSPFRPAAATSISAFDDITRKERIRRKTMQSSHKTDIQGHSNVSSNNWMARPTQQHWPLASPAQLQVWVPPFRPAAARSISAFDDITSHYSLQQLFRPWQALRHLILHMRRQYFEDCKRINHY